MRSKLTKIAQNFTILVILIGGIGVQTSHAAYPQELLGVWLKESDGLSTEFYNNGTGVMYGMIRFSWAVENNNVLVCNYPDLGIIAGAYKVSGPRLVINYTDGSSIVWLRKAEYEKTKKNAAEEAKKAAEEERKEIEKISNYFTDSRDGKKYRTVKIGTQTWMAENLNYAGKNDDIGVCYNKNSEMCKVCGALYTRDEAKKVCPSGWHLPSQKEWKTLIDFAGGDEIAGKKLKKKREWKEHEHKCKYEEKTGRGNIIVIDKCVTDEFGFSALPCGSGNFRGALEVGYWWSASGYFSDDVYLRMDYSSEGAKVNNSDGSSGLSVRCVKD